MDDPRYQRATGACQDRPKPGLGRHHIVQHFVFGVSNDEMFQFAYLGLGITLDVEYCHIPFNNSCMYSSVVDCY